MKKFVKHIAVIIVLVTAVLSILFVINKYWLLADNYLMEFPVKRKMLEQKESPRIIFQGGSNVAFGIDSKTISDSLHLPVVNSGLHAGLGLKYIMDSSFSLYRKDDVLVIMPEYEHFFGKGAYGEEITLGYLPYIGTLSDFRNLNYCQFAVVSKGFVQMTLRNILDACKGKSVTEDKFVYSKSGFNEWGDEISHWYKKRDIEPAVESPLPELNTAYIDYFATQIAELRKRGVNIVLLPPATSAANVKMNQNKLEELTAMFSLKNIPFSAPCNLFGYDSTYIYNTLYHLNKSGVSVNTYHVISALKKLN